MGLFNFKFKKNKINNENISTICQKHYWASKIPFNSKKRCTTNEGYAFKDDLDRQWKFCIKHGCRICTEEIKESQGEPHELGNGFLVCRRSSCEAIMSKTSEKIDELKEKNNELKEILFEAGFNSASGLYFKELADRLVELEIEEISRNVKSEPVILPDGLNNIKMIIDKEPERLLSAKEKGILKETYENGKGKVENIYGEKIGAFTKILSERKEKILTLNQQREDFIENLLKKLTDWNLLSESQKNKYVSEINARAPSYFNVVLVNAKKEIKRIRESNDRGEPKGQEPPTQTPRAPSPDEKPNKDNPAPELPNNLEQVKQQIKAQHNLSEVEFAAIIVPVQDKEVLGWISLLLGAIKKARQAIKSITLVDSSYEVLIAYSEASEDTKKKAYQAVNSYQNQVDRLINDLAVVKKLISDCLNEIVSSQDEEKLNEFYEVAKSLEQFQQGDNQQAINNHEKRTRAAILIEAQTSVNEVEKHLAQKLRTVISGDTDKDVLLLLQKELQEIQSGSKKAIYDAHQEVIDLTLLEINQELVRRNHSEKEIQKKPQFEKQIPTETSDLTWTIGLSIIGGAIVLVPFLVWLCRWRRKQLSKRKNK